MKLTQYFIPTLKETPKDAEAKSHIVMLRSGMIRKLASGYYSYLPLGLRVLKKIETIVREEMNQEGAIEVLMPAVHPSEIWQKTGRYELLDEILLKIEKGDKEYVLGPTHEEIITELATAYLKSYKELPKILYQIQTKFRHEARPRFGVIRSREFIMKDAYSFNKDEADLEQSYSRMYDAYNRIFNRCGLHFVVVQADTGAMGGSSSHEFMVLVDFGEDKVVISESSGEAWSVEVAACHPEESLKDLSRDPATMLPLERFATPNLKTIEEMTKKFDLKPDHLVKSIVYQVDDEVILALVRGDHEICEPKLAKAVGAAKLALAGEETIQKVTGAKVGFAGPVNLKEKVRIFADQAVASMHNFVTGANKDDEHLKNVNIERDFKIDDIADIRQIQDGDLCPDGSEKVKIRTSLEIGHVFKLGTKYTKAFSGKYLDQDGKEQQIIMGCYGIGVNRILAACIEQHYGEKGMVWPHSIAPFNVSIITANQKSEPVVAAAEKLYAELREKGVDVLYDDRNDRMGAKLNDAELIGAPIHVIIGDRGLKEGKLEVRDRMSGEEMNVAVDEVVSKIQELIS